MLEPLNVLVNHAGYHVVTSEHAAHIVAGVGSPQVKILFDIYHQQISEGNLISNIEKHWERIGYFQVGDVPGRKEPGTGEIRYKAVFERIHAKGYEGILGMEHGLSQPGRAGPGEVLRGVPQGRYVDVRPVIGARGAEIRRVCALEFPSDVDEPAHETGMGLHSSLLPRWLPVLPRRRTLAGEGAAAGSGVQRR